MTKKILYPGSFDPWHAGHQYVYDCACDLVGRENVFIGLATDPKKFKPTEKFCSPIKKCEFLRWTLAPLCAQTVIVKNTSVETCRDLGADFMVRGLRPSYDLPQEAALDFWNRRLSGNKIKTLFFMTPSSTDHLSSTAIREMVKYDPTEASFSQYIDPYVFSRWKNGSIPENALYFGPKCVGKSTYCESLKNSWDVQTSDCDKAIWGHLRLGENDRKIIENNFRRAIWEKDKLAYESLMDEIGKSINWSEFLTPDRSYEVSALGAYFNYIPEEVIGKFVLVKINTTLEERTKRAEKRGCLKTLESFDFFYKDPPFYDNEIMV